MSDPAEGVSLLKLPADLNFNAAPALLDRLRALRGHALEIDACEVERLGGLCLQALMSARLTWKTDRTPLKVKNASNAFAAALALHAVNLS